MGGSTVYGMPLYPITVYSLLSTSSNSVKTAIECPAQSVHFVSFNAIHFGPTVTIGTICMYISSVGVNTLHGNRAYTLILHDVYNATVKSLSVSCAACNLTDYRHGKTTTTVTTTEFVNAHTHIYYTIL